MLIQNGLGKWKQIFWGLGFPFSSTVSFGEISNSARRRGLGRNAGRVLKINFFKFLYKAQIKKLIYNKNGSCLLEVEIQIPTTRTKATTCFEFHAHQLRVSNFLLLYH